MKGLIVLVCAGVLCVLLMGCTVKAEKEGSTMPHVKWDNPIEAGKYLVTIAGCNDCHTHGFMVEGMRIPEAEWLTGSPLGWQGPWGTSYPANLRLRVHEIDENQWVKLLKNGKGLPPMPWENVNHISEPDARAIYAYIKSLGKKGERMPLAVAPGVELATPYLSMFPQNMPVAVD